MVCKKGQCDITHFATKFYMVYRIKLSLQQACGDSTYLGVKE